MNIAIFGFGVIGKGVKNVLDTYNPYNIKIVKIFDRIENKDKIGSLFSCDYEEIINDLSIDTIVEAMGGNEFPYKIIKSALLKGKNVVTSNKEVVSLHLKEFLELSRNNNFKFLFEASCGGGVPIINGLLENIKVNKINEVIGILNGTTNYIITRIEEGMDFDSALKLAQVNGFAEADPTADLEGLDMVRKISIIGDIIGNTFIDINKVHHESIRGISLDIINYLNSIGKSIKYCSHLIINDNKIFLEVLPIIIDKNNILSNCKDEFNMIIFNGETNGKLGFYGKGAGSNPTASAIVSDLVRIIEGTSVINIKLDKEYEYLEDDKLVEYFCVINGDIDNNFIITKKISSKEFNKIKENVSFYGKVI